jgi:hypothetical protein
VNDFLLVLQPLLSIFLPLFGSIFHLLALQFFFHSFYFLSLQFDLGVLVGFRSLFEYTFSLCPFQLNQFLSFFDQLCHQKFFSLLIGLLLFLQNVFVYFLSLIFPLAAVDQLISFDVVLFRDDALSRFAVEREGFGVTALSFHFKK